MKRAVVVLDIDGTITTADQKALQRLKALSEHKSWLSDLYINTAREETYCRHPSTETTEWVSKQNSFCRPKTGDPVEWKVRNMDIISRLEGVPPRCAVLVDDRPENIQGVLSHGYEGVQVDARYGITNETVDEILEKLQVCQ